MSFCRYFFHYIFHSKTRQRLLLLAMIGLFISSFALLVLQSTMGGLQNKLILRSKAVLGDARIELTGEEQNEDRALALWQKVTTLGIKAYPEYQIELLARQGRYLAPVIIHTLSAAPSASRPEFLQGHIFEDVLLTSDLAVKLNVVTGEKINLISPSHVDPFMGDIPRSVSATVSGPITTDVPEVDLYHAWARTELIQNLIRQKKLNRLVLYGNVDTSVLKQELLEWGSFGKLITWEEENNTLVWALRLEQMVMLFLFAAMTLLVSLCITSGLMIFLDKVKEDMASFWVLGASEKRLEKTSLIFVNLITLITVSLGLGAAIIFLQLLDYSTFEIMPDVFVDRKIPVLITSKGVMISFFIPYAIAMLFSWPSLRRMRKETSYLEQVRAH